MLGHLGADKTFLRCTKMQNWWNEYDILMANYQSMFADNVCTNPDMLNITLAVIEAKLDLQGVAKEKKELEKKVKSFWREKKTWEDKKTTRCIPKERTSTESQEKSARSAETCPGVNHREDCPTQ